MISERYHSPRFWARFWRSKGSVKSTACLDSDPDSDDEVAGLPATTDKQTETMQDPLFGSDTRVSPGSDEKSRVCCFHRHLQHQRKRIEMFIKRVAEKGGLGTKKGILVTTRIEVVSTPVPSPASLHHTFRSDHTVTSMDFVTAGDDLASPRSLSRLMVSPRSFYTVDAQAGAERGNIRRHSLPFPSSLPFTKSTHVASRPRACSQNAGGTSILGLEAEWARCLEGAAARSSVSRGTLESRKGEDGGMGGGGAGLDGKRRVLWRAGMRRAGLLGFGKGIGGVGKVH
ncbi:hypothetical protein Vi05172_g6674 [Venturia inaequalis]|nr:hypothetical protein Vi05172_g6674 [Venturia inaequalis]